jgi:L-lactate dehydrogenase complex protein LldG
MSESRRQILDALHAARDPFPEAQTPSTYRPVIPREKTDAAALLEQFTREAEKQAVVMHRVTDEAQALQTLGTLLEGRSRIASWDPAEIGLSGLAEMLREKEIDIADPRDETPEIGLTGAMAGLAATGSLVLSSGSGMYRNTSLLPPVHIAVLRQDQIVPDLESWFAQQREQDFRPMRDASNIVIVTGPSRTADIAMELVMGMHGPREMHIILVEG